LVAAKVCKKIIESKYEKRGVLICGTGIGMCMAANKFRGIRAAVCHDIFSARRSVLSNKGNVACFGERVIGAELAKAILADWVGLEFKDGPSTPKVAEILNLEKENFK
jgi:ribose 5-phosphate isomerase B